jgi:hypothetical protein
MPNRRLKEIIILSAVLLFCVGWLIDIMLKNVVPEDVGDGIMHFFISNASWQHPELFLHHWGKPLFILLSSPFSQFGFNGLVLFNILVFVTTCIIGFKFLQQRKAPIYIQVLLPLILLKAHDVANTILGGLTEPLFNLSLILALFLLNNKKYAWFALVVSTMPFLRSEGQLPVILALLILVYERQYKYIPLLTVAFIIYGISGIFVYNDFMWYFNESPYAMNNGIYGHGTWDHYLLSYKNYIGNPGLYIFLLAIPAFIYMLIKKIQIDWSNWIFSYGVFFGILIAHSYFWATGQNGSLGLTRIATQGVPLFLVMNLSILGKVPLSEKIFCKAVFIIFSLAIVNAILTNKYYPKEIAALDQQILNTADFLKNQDLGARKVYYHFPLLSFAYGENPFKDNNRLIYYTFSNLENDLRTTLKPGDLIVRDSHFGPVEMALPMEKINKHPSLRIVKEFLSTNQIVDERNETEGVIILEYQPNNKLNKYNPSISTIAIDSLLKIPENQEFTGINCFFPTTNQDLKVTVTLTADQDGFALVYDHDNGASYSLMDLKAGQVFEGTFLYFGDGNTKIYVWNPRKLKGAIHLKKISCAKPINVSL